MRSRSSTHLLFAAIALTVVIRGLVIALSPTAFQSDPDAYRAIADTIDQSGVFGLTSPDGIPRAIAFRPPLYPWLLSFCVTDGELSTLAITLLHLTLAVLTSCFVFLATRRYSRLLDPATTDNAADRLGLASSVIIAVDPILLSQSTEVMTETLAAALTAAVIWLWGRWNLDGIFDGNGKSDTVWIPMGLGGLLALAYLCRPTFLVWAVLLVLATVARYPHRRGIRSAAAIAALVFLAVAGWTLRNVRAIGHPVWATTHGGYTLLLANNELFYQYLLESSFGQTWDAQPFLDAYQHRYEGDPRDAAFWRRDWHGDASFDAATSEYDDDRLCYESAMATIKRQPTVFLWSAVVRAGRLWSPFPHDIAGRSKTKVLLVGSYYAACYLAVLVTVLRNRRSVFSSRWWAIWLLAITLTGVHAVYWSNLRMRAPAIPAIATLAVLCVVRPSGRHAPS